jgi:phosphatidylserine/phosphatidylglycerophosphate/cardiolipin synthase-like enzyme
LNNHLYTVYFCPEDECADKVYNILLDAEKSIKFMTFSFTRTDYSDLLIEKSRSVSVSGIFEKTRVNQKYNVYKKLNQSKTDEPGLQLDLKLDDNKYNFHHKVFIIDDKIVVTGSFNPTKSADLYNDENVIILTDPVLVSKYVEEFDRLFS